MLCNFNTVTNSFSSNSLCFGKISLHTHNSFHWNKNRQEWEVWEWIFLLHLSKLVYVQHRSSVCPRIEGLHKWFQCSSPLSVLVGSPQVEELEMYVFSKWPMLLIFRKKNYSIRSQPSVNSIMCYYFASGLYHCVCQGKVNGHLVQQQVRLWRLFSIVPSVILVNSDYLQLNYDYDLCITSSKPF